MTMHAGLSSLMAVGTFVPGLDGIYSAPTQSFAHDQDVERNLRERVAAQALDDYLGSVAQSHSIPVMDHEIARFLATIPQRGIILDVGGCWGWHWRTLAAIRPDVGVLIIDFVRANLLRAKRELAGLVGVQVALMHADATALPFPDPVSSWQGFDGVWSVQVFQHIPDFGRACREVHRVLRSGGRFVTYSLHLTPFNRAIHRLLGKPYHTDGMVENQYHLTRANDRQRRLVAEIFGNVKDRYTECLFHPDLRFRYSGRAGSLLGRIDARLGGIPLLGKLCARQRSFEATKR